MRNKSIRDVFLGMLLGALGNGLGFLIFGTILSLVNGVTFSYFYRNMFLETEIFRSQIITGSLLVNVVLFYVLMRKGKDSINRGVMITILLTMIAFVYYYI